jgi:hypothetical protein
MTLTPKERLDAHAERLKARGVVDVKFAYGDLTGVSVDQLASDVADVLDAIERREFTKLKPLLDSRSLKTRSPGARRSGAGLGEGHEANQESGETAP